MNSIKKQGCLILIFCLSGIVFYSIFNQWIIIPKPLVVTGSNSEQSSINKKKVILYYFYQEKWCIEEQNHLWTDNITKNLLQLICSWLTFLYEENILTKKTSLESVLISESSTAYFSFDHNIFTKNDSIFSKWMLIEGLLKTIRANNIPINHLQLLIQHQYIQDSHLDFFSPWPITGFIE